MREGYVTFVNDNPLYRGLVDILVESVLLFSTRKIEVHGINFDYKHSSDNVLSRRIDIDEVNFRTICYSKLKASYTSEFDFGIQLDSDFIITKDMDKLFNEKERVNELPLCSLHPDQPNNLKNIMSYLGVNKKTQPYVHATYLFSNKTKPFLEECFNISQEMNRKNIIPPNVDETILNVMLWKYNSNQWVDTYDPYYEYFINRDNVKIPNYNWMDNVNFYSCHGIKSPEYARNVLNSLIINQQ